MCNLLIQNEGNSCSSTLSREKDLAYGLQDEELLLNSAAESLAERLNENKEEQQQNDTEQDSALNRESERVKEMSPQPNGSEITLEVTDGTSSPLANGEMAAEITSARAISVASIKSPIQYNLFAIAVRYHIIMLLCVLLCTNIIESHRRTRGRSLCFICKES